MYIFWWYPWSLTVRLYPKTAQSLLRVRYTNQSGKFLSKFVREQNLLALSGSTWKEPGNIEGCHREQLYESHFCVYCKDVVKDVVGDIPQCFLCEDVLKKCFSSLRTAINHISPEQRGSLHIIGTINCGLSVCIPISRVLKRYYTLESSGELFKCKFSGSPAQLRWKLKRRTSIFQVL